MTNDCTNTADFQPESPKNPNGAENASALDVQAFTGGGVSSIPPKPAPAHITPDLALNIPVELKAIDRWVIWAWRWNPDKQKWDKPAVSPADGGEIDQTDPANHMSFDRACEVAREAGSGCGFAMGTKEDAAILKRVGIDIDHCIDAAGNISPEAIELVKRLDSYTERTPSRQGLRVWIEGVKPGDKCRKPSHSDRFLATVEIYAHSRYFTVTGQHLEGTPRTIEARQAELDKLYAYMFGPGQEPQENGRHVAKMSSTVGVGSASRATTVCGGTDDEVFALIGRSKDAAKFDALWAGQWKGYAPSRSEADASLANLLVFFCGAGNEDQARRLFLQSGLAQRNKALRDDYIDATIALALKGRTDFFDWARQPVLTAGPNGKPASRAAKQTKASSAQALDIPYIERGGGTYHVTLDKDGNPFEKRIAGFTARITKEVAKHEAGETHRQFEIQATHEDGTVKSTAIEAADFEAMQWVAGGLGAKFVIEPGRGTRDLMRHALQLLSHRDQSTEYLEIFGALGWHTISGEQVFLHCGGGIGAAGPVAVHVETEKALAAYCLPAPDESRLAQAVEQVLIALDTLGTGPAGSIIVSIPYRAILGPARFVPHFSGSTGTFKTSSACLIARFFAPGLEYGDPMPATWSSTANGLQRLQHDAGDLVLVVDNLVADGDQVARELYKADFVFNSQGDLAGRRRMKADGSLAAVLDPRTSIVSTGECDPRRRSALGRSLIIEFTPGMINFDNLKRCHDAACAGHYAMTISCYAKYLAAPGRLDARRQELRRLASGYQAAALKHTPGCHPRQAEAVAELIAAWRLFLGFAVAQGALTRNRADAHVDKVRGQLFDLLAVQASIQTESDPGEIFLDLVRSLLASKRAVLNATDGTMPPVDIAGACGWERVEISTKVGPVRDWQPAPGSARIGWVDDDHVYLDPAAAYAAAEKLARETRQVLGTQRQTLARLAETNRILTDPCTTGDRRRFTRKVIVEKSRRSVLYILRDEVLALAPSRSQAAGGAPY